MSVELAVSGLNLVTLIGYLILTERRLTRMETFLFEGKKHGN